MRCLEKVKILISLSKLANSDLGIDDQVIEAKSILENEWKINLESPKSTTPKKLFGKSYSELSKDELAEYSQIKRIIRRFEENEQI